MAPTAEDCEFLPSLPALEELLFSDLEKKCPKGNTIPVYTEILADLLTPVQAYLRLSAGGEKFSFLFEAVAEGQHVGRYSIIGADPYKTLRTGDSEPITGDPLNALDAELRDINYVAVPGLPHFTGGAVGFIAYDCVKYFEPRISRELSDPLGLPESHFLFCDTVVVFDHLFQLVKVISHVHLDEGSDLGVEYHRACGEVRNAVALLLDTNTPYPKQPPIVRNQVATSNTGKEGYEEFVRKLKTHIVDGDIIQAVPSQRLARPTTLHPFNVYRYLRTVNPSPYLFYVNYKDYQLVGASPELMVKVEKRKVYTHPIAGTRRRGANLEEDAALAEDLLADVKERSEHIMLVDLGRNDVNRVCKPETVKVDSLMKIEKYSHVMHIVSQVSGQLRDDQTAFDAFRSIFPAGTVSGAPKVRAMELIAELEGEKRGVYAGAVGHFGYNGDLDTCIAIRTLLMKDGVAYLQAGAGIVHDSVPVTEFEETVSKLGSNVSTIMRAEEYYYKLEQKSSTSMEI